MGVDPDDGPVVLALVGEVVRAVLVGWLQLGKPHLLRVLEVEPQRAPAVWVRAKPRGRDGLVLGPEFPVVKESGGRVPL